MILLAVYLVCVLMSWIYKVINNRGAGKSKGKGKKGGKKWGRREYRRLPLAPVEALSPFLLNTPPEHQSIIS